MLTVFHKFTAYFPNFVVANYHRLMLSQPILVLSNHASFRPMTVHVLAVSFEFSFPLSQSGYTLPELIEPLPLEVHDTSVAATCMQLPLKAEFSGRTPKGMELRSNLSGISAVVLLFLRKLRCIKLVDAVSNEQTLAFKERCVAALCAA